MEELGNYRGNNAEINIHGAQGKRLNISRKYLSHYTQRDCLKSKTEDYNESQQGNYGHKLKFFGVNVGAVFDVQKYGVYEQSNGGPYYGNN